MLSEDESQRRVSEATESRDLLVSISDALQRGSSLLEVAPLNELLMVSKLLRELAVYHPALASMRSLYLIRLATEVKELACPLAFLCRLKSLGFLPEELSLPVPPEMDL